jgi:hypothetical protein
VNNPGSSAKPGSRSAGSSRFVDLGSRDWAVPELKCPGCGGPARTEPLLTSTVNGVTTCSYPVTCKGDCVETYISKGKEKVRPLRTYHPAALAKPSPSTKPLPPIKPKEKENEMPTVTKADLAMVARVREIKEARGLNWSALAREAKVAHSASVTSAVQKPDRYLYEPVKKALYAWLKDQQENPVEAPKVFGVPVVATEAMPPGEIATVSPAEPAVPRPGSIEELDAILGMNDPEFNPEPYPETAAPEPVVITFSEPIPEPRADVLAAAALPESDDEPIGLEEPEMVAGYEVPKLRRVEPFGNVRVAFREFEISITRHSNGEIEGTLFNHSLAPGKQRGFHLSKEMVEGQEIINGCPPNWLQNTIANLNADRKRADKRLNDYQRVLGQVLNRVATIQMMIWLEDQGIEGVDARCHVFATVGGRDEV